MANLRTMFQDRGGDWDAMTIVAFGVGGLGVGAIGSILLSAFVSMLLRPDHVFDAQQVGIGVGSIIGGLGPFLAGYAAYWASDAWNKRKAEWHDGGGSGGNGHPD